MTNFEIAVTLVLIAYGIIFGIVCAGLFSRTRINKSCIEVTNKVLDCHNIRIDGVVDRMDNLVQIISDRMEEYNDNANGCSANGCSMEKCPINAFTFKSCNLSENECEYYTKQMNRFNHDNEETNPLENILFNDYVNRKDVINQIFFSSDNTCDVVLSTKLMDRIKRIPGIQPRLKGYWIVVNGNRETGYGGCTICSECQEEGNTEMNFCPNCGARMEREVEE